MKIQQKILLMVVLILFVVGCAPMMQPPLPPLASGSSPAAGSKSAAKVDNFQIIIDTSLSMDEGRNDFLVARDLVSRINQAIPADLSYNGGLRSFGHNGYQSKNPTDLLYGMTSYNRNDLHAGLGKIKYTGGSSLLTTAFESAASDLQSASGKSALIVVSDGLDMADAPAAAKKIKAMMGENLCIYTVAIGNGNNGAGRKLLKLVTEAGQCGSAVTSNDLADNAKLTAFVNSVFVTDKPASKPVPKPVPAPVPAPKPLIKDSDGDGVLDPADKCPNTPRGEMVDEDGCTLKMTLGINFDHDKADIKAEFKGELDRAAAYVKRYSKIPFIVIAGHTDSTGPKAYNQKLSMKRAAAVHHYLIANYGIDEKKIVVRGYGEMRPVADNKTKNGRYTNRRVEVVLSSILPPE